MSQNRYEVLGKIADGGLGSVFKAYDRNLRREVALKRVRADSPEEADRQAEQLFEEARTLSTLQHPHIVTIFDVGKDDEGAYIVMELLKGETLEDIVERGALNEGDFHQLATQSLEGMIAAHATGLIHLDIKPQNFMVIWLPSGKFQIKVLDFGLSKIAHQPLIQETDDDGAIMGSIFFMAPEQFERSPVDVRTDIYSIGCAYYFALTQHYPFQGDTGPEVMASHLYHSFIPLEQLRPDLPRWLCQWVEWLLSRSPDDRPPTMENALEWFQAGQSPRTEEEAAASRAAQLPPPDLRGPERTPLPGTTSQLLRRSAPRFSRPGGITQALGQRPVPKPLAKPVTIAAAAAPKHLQYRRKLPKWLKVWVPISLLAIALLGLGYKQVRRSLDESRFEKLAQMEKPEGTAQDFTMLLQFLEDPRNSDAAGDLLGKIRGVPYPERLLMVHARNVREPWARKNFAKVVAARNATDATEFMLLQLGKASEKDVRMATWSALARIGTNADVPFMLEHLAKTGDVEELRYAENALVSAAKTEPDADRRSLAPLQAYRANSGSEDVQSALIRALGRLGGSNALGELTKALEHASAKIRTAASLALGDWPNAEPVAALEGQIAREKDPFIRTNAVNSLGSLAPLSGDTPQEEIAQALVKAYRATRDNREQLAILHALAGVAHVSAVEFLREIASQDPRRKPTTDSAIRTITAALDRKVVVGQSALLPHAQAELSPGPLTVIDGVITNWLNLGDQVNWLIQLDQPGEYEIQLTQAFDRQSPGRYRLTFGKESFLKSVERTSGPGEFTTVKGGRARFSKPGLYRVWIRPQNIASGQYLMRLKEATVTRLGP